MLPSQHIAYIGDCQLRAGYRPTEKRPGYILLSENCLSNLNFTNNCPKLSPKLLSANQPDTGVNICANPSRAEAEAEAVAGCSPNPTEAESEEEAVAGLMYSWSQLISPHVSSEMRKGPLNWI